MSTKVTTHEVSEQEEGQRLDNFLFKKFKKTPKSHIYRVIRKGEVRINKKRAKPETKLELNDIVRIPPIEEVEGDIKLPPPTQLMARVLKDVLYEDDDVLILNKPAGIAVHSGTGQDYGIIELLRIARENAPYLELVHRLDKETSGCLIIAKNRATLLDLHQLLKAGEMFKEYMALVHGHWPRTLKKVQDNLKRGKLHSGERGVIIDKEGKAAETSFAVKKYVGPMSWLTIVLHTGRMHQIRVQTAEQGYPVAGDVKYGDWAHDKALASRGLKRMALHAHRLEFQLTKSGKMIKVSAPWPQELKDLMEKL